MKLWIIGNDGEPQDRTGDWSKHARHDNPQEYIRGGAPQSGDWVHKDHGGNRHDLGVVRDVRPVRAWPFADYEVDVDWEGELGI